MVVKAKGSCGDCGAPVSTTTAKRCWECTVRHRADRLRSNLAPRLWSRVKRGDDNECWEWMGRRTQHGYGLLYPSYAHRVSYELTNGPVPSGLWVLHHCDNPPCVNPSHLWVGTPRQNTRDAMAKGRRPTAGVA